MSTRSETEANSNLFTGSDQSAASTLSPSATYRQLRDSGLSDPDIMAFAGELLSLVASEYRSQSAAE